MSRPTLGVGMLGYGFMGKVHSECYRQLRTHYDPWPADIRFVGIATRHQRSADHAREQIGYEFATTDWRKVVEHPEVDVVNVCTPNDQHHEQVLAAIAAGKHVCCDKPLAANFDQAQEMACAAHRGGTVHQMTQNYRFVPALRRAKQLVEEGFLGRPYTFRAAYLHGGSSDPSRPVGWKMQDGGTLHDLGAHVMDLVRHLWGEFDEVTARRAIFVAERPATADSPDMVTITGDDAAWLIVRLTNGAIGTIETSKVATGVEDELRIELHGDKGALRFNLMDPNWLDVYDARRLDGAFGGERGFQRIAACARDETTPHVPPSRGTVGWMHFHLASLHSFVVNVVNRTVGSPNFFDGWAAHEVFRAAEESHRTGTWVKVRPATELR